MSVLQLDPLANENAEAALAHARQGQPGPVLIVGGGIGGLAAALALARRGIPSQVLERRPAFHEEGAGIQIGPNGTRILRRLGVADELRPHVGVPDALSVRDGRTGAEIAKLPLGRWIAMRHGAPYWVAHRKDLHAALLHAVRTEPLIALSMGFAASEVASGNGHVAVAAESGEAWSGRALIAADGIWSPLRSLLFDATRPRFCGKSAARSVVPLDALPADFQRNETTIWLFANTHVVHYPVCGGTELAIVVVLDDLHDSSDWSAPVPPFWIQQSMPPCAEPLQALILEARTWKRWALHTLPVPRQWAHGSIALLGDAAHPMLPFLAQGGVMALEDATVIAEALHRYTDDVPAALRWYQRQRRPRVQRVVRASRRNGRIYHLAGPAALARNFVLRKLPAQRLMARYDWLYGWRPIETTSQ
ncbi:MAG: FAD-dependent monooxygenase [Hyphomicrobium sp.]|nr:FAD-dependent monooxygenase [Hyphomicrobium sp.]